MDKKRRLFRLIEYYINDFRKDAVEGYYGKGSRVKIHTMNYSITNKTILFEVVVILAGTITEETLDRTLVDVLLQDALVYIFPDQKISAYVRWDV